MRTTSPNILATVVCHGGSASNPRHTDGPSHACLIRLQGIARPDGTLGAAVAATGEDEPIARSLLTYRAYDELEQGRAPERVVDRAMNQLIGSVDVGIIVVNRLGFAGGARHGMAWSGRSMKAPA